MLMLKAFSKVAKNLPSKVFVKNTFENHKFSVPAKCFSVKDTSGRQKIPEGTSYKDQFESLRQKIDSQKTKEDVLQGLKNVKQDMLSKLRFVRSIQKDTQAETSKNEKIQEADKSSKNISDETMKDENNRSQENTDPSKIEGTKLEKVSWRETLREKNPSTARLIDYCADTWNETFPPDDEYEHKKQITKRKAKQLNKQRIEEEALVYTEEELQNMQENIPDWKRTSLQKVIEGVQENSSVATRIREKIITRVNQTALAQKIYGSEEYKEYEEFKKEISQFKSDLRDHMQQSQNPIIQGSLGVYDQVKSESSTAKAILEMRRIDPEFDIYELERDAKGIFRYVYNAFLHGDLTNIEKQCGDMALGYFRVLLKKRDVEKVEPKFKELWDIDNADLVGGQIPENKYPSFTFTVRTQEIHCNMSLKEDKITDGAEDRIMHCQYSFVLTPHQNPDMETVGHKWELVELTQIGSMLALV